MVVFKNIEGETVRVFSSSLDGLGEYLDKGVLKGPGYKELEEFVKDKTLVGYNNYFYDDYILYAMSKNLPQKILKQWNDSIIKNKSNVNMKKIQICKTIDCFQQIDVSKPSLKKIEGNMGKSIVESEVDFDVDRELTPFENLETMKYCEYDVLNTIEIYKMRHEYFDSKEKIIEMLGDNLKERAVKWNTTSIVGQMLRPKQKALHRRLVSDEWLELVPFKVAEMWRQLDTTIDFRFKQKKVVINDFGNSIEFGWGGLHGAPNGVFEARNVKLLDVASMYPNILINLNGLGDMTEHYKGVLEYRLELKHRGKKKEQAPYKLILNSTYGLLNNQYSALNNPHLAFSICIYGQIALYNLCKMLSGVGCKIFNINTDGVGFVPDNEENYKKVWKDWENMFNLELELDNFKYWIQKDVNNYIAVDDKDSIKTKGGDVNKYHTDNFFANNDIRIVQIALVDKIVRNIPIEETIYKNLDNPRLFQYVLKAGNTYQGTFDNTGKKLQNVNRVFAGKDTGYEIFKKRMDGGLVKFADAPGEMILYNGDLENMDLEKFKRELNVQWYYDLTNKNYSRWKI